MHAACEARGTGMILAADSEYIPSPLHLNHDLMLVTWEIGFPIPPVSRSFRETGTPRFPIRRNRDSETGGKQGIPDSRFGREREWGSRGRRAGGFLVWPDRSARHGCLELEKGGFARHFLDTPCSRSVKKCLKFPKKKYGWRTLVRRTGLKTRRRPTARRLCTIAEN